MEDQVRAAIVDELMRQGAVERDRLAVTLGDNGALVVEGSVDVDALVMAVVGAVAGGP